MIKIKHTSAFIVLFFFVSLVSLGQSRKITGNGNRIYFGPVLSFYKLNTHHAVDASQKMSGLVGFKRERRLGRDYKTFFLYGVDYFFHGLNLKSYYFVKDSLKLYNKNFDYTYSVFIHEFNLPLQFKYLFRSENNSLFSPYMAVSYHLRYLLPGSLKVTQSGNLIREDNADVKFKHPFILDELNAFVSLSLGWQKNSLTHSAQGNFFAELNYRYAFSPVYFEKDYAASSLFINGTHVALLLGLKF